MAKPEALFAVAEREHNELVKFLRRQANEASDAGLLPQKRTRAIRTGLSVGHIVLGATLLAATIAPLSHVAEVWVTRAAALLVIVVAIAAGRVLNGPDQDAIGFHLRIWTLCERCIELLASSHEPGKVHEYYLQHRARLDRGLRGRPLIG